MRVDRLMVLMAMVCGVSHAQQTIGTVGLQDATVGGALVVSNGRAVLAGNTTVTAGDHASEITLSRGGKVLVCATSGLHLTAGSGYAADRPLMLALDRGALEIQMPVTQRDTLMTPDLRFTMQTDGPLDLRLRVTRNGDTCVENRGPQAPVLHIADQFGGATYDLHAGQHVLFEHGDLREVVDHESSDCGCPPEPSMSIADALLHPGGLGAAGAENKPSAAKTTAEAHPFPAAVSAELAPSSAAPQAPAGAVHVQVAATLSSDGGSDSTTVPESAAGSTAGSAPGNGTTGAGAATSSAAAPSGTPGPAPATPTVPPPASSGESKGLFHSMGRFFRRIFGGG